MLKKYYSLTFSSTQKTMLSSSISQKAFWDIAFGKLDLEKSSLFVMEKVFNYGNWNDQINVMKYYGLPVSGMR